MHFKKYGTTLSFSTICMIENIYECCPLQKQHNEKFKVKAVSEYRYVHMYTYISGLKTTICPIHFPA